MPVKPVPDGYHTVTPFLQTKNAAGVIEFIVAAFGAVVTDRMDDPDGTVRHAEARIGDSRIMFGESRPDYPGMASMLYLYVPDVDAVYARAIAAGATSLRAPTNEFYGDRSSGVKDISGNQWWIATHVEDVSKEEMQKRMEALPAR